MALVNTGSLLIITARISLLMYQTVWVHGSDPELITDFANIEIQPLDGNHFTFTGFRGGISTPLGEAGLKTAYVSDFPALEGLGISFALMYFQPWGLLAPHLHPRGSKLIYVIEGTLTVGFMDSTDKLYNQTLQASDVFVVPKGMVHYMVNLDNEREVKVIFSFSSSNPGKINLPTNLFGSSIPHLILQKSFNMSEKEVERLTSTFSHKKAY